MPEEHVVKIKVGCHPEAGTSGAVLFQTENAAFLLFNAMSDEQDSHGRLGDVGTAVIEFVKCRVTRFGSPNDEALPEHSLYHKGLADCSYGICEVVNSSWAAEAMDRAKKSAERICMDRFSHANQDVDWKTRHFLIAFHDSTFECLADDFVLSLSKEPFAQIIARICRKIAEG